MTKHEATSSAANNEVVPCHRQDQLLAIKGLDLALLIDAKDEGRRKVEADDVTDLVDE